jgi:type II restriction enzyme
MALSPEQKDIIKLTIKNSLLKRFESYNPEPAYMPFHTRLLGKDRLALYSFIHSLNTNFGTSIFEPVAITLSNNNFKIAKKQVKLDGYISESALFEIQKIIDNLVVARKRPDKQSEIEILRNVCRKGNMRKVKPTRVDIYLEDHKGKIYLIDIKTAKPNKGNFKEFKRTLLEWVAIILADNPKADISSLIAIPYNPYEPKPYSRWTMAGMLDLENELKVANEFWDFLAGSDAYEDLLDTFESAGLELRTVIDNYFLKFK